MREGASLFIFGARRTVHRATIALEDSGFLVRDVLIWEKNVAHRRAQSLSNLLMKRGLPKEAEEWDGWRLGNLAPIFEPIVWLFKPYEYTITDNVLKNKLGAMNITACSIGGKSPTNILKFGFKKSEGKYHEAQKPVDLMKYLIRLVTVEGQTVLDPFIGSGTTAVACKELKRNFIGVEISEKYCEAANERIKNAAPEKQRVDQKVLF